MNEYESWPCVVCGKGFTDDQWFAHHSSPGGEPVHEDCCRWCSNDPTFWGSDCTSCGNATPGSMTCDECNSDVDTVRLQVIA